MAEVKSRTPAKKPAPAKTAAKATAKTAAKTAPAKSTVAKAATKPVAAKPAAKKGNGITAEQRYRMIAEAAYYIAEKRGFMPGDPSRDWSEAEAQIRVMFSA